MERITDSVPHALALPGGSGPSALDGPHAALRRAIQAAGGQKPLARRIGTTQSRVWYWLEKSRHGAAAPFVSAIEAETGVPRHALRPDIFPVPVPAQCHTTDKEARDAGRP